MTCGLAVSKSSRRLGLGIVDATVEEVVGVRKAAYHRTHQDELADQRGILQSEIDGSFAAVGAADDDGVTYFSIAEERSEIFRFRIPGGRGRSAAVPAAVVADGMESFAEGGPNVVPDGGVSDALMDKNDSVGTSSAFFVVELPALNVYKCPRYGSRAAGALGGKAWRPAAFRLRQSAGRTTKA